MDTSLRSVWQKGKINQQDKSVWQFYKYDKDFVSKTKFKGLVWIFYEFKFFALLVAGKFWKGVNSGVLALCR